MTKKLEESVADVDDGRDGQAATVAPPGEPKKCNDSSCHDDDFFDRFPVELLEIVLMRTYVGLFARTYKRTLNAGEETYSNLGSVTFSWWQTMKGWPHSDTKLWFRHRLRRRIHVSCRPYHRCASLVADMPIPGKETAVAHADGHIYVAWRFCDTIRVFTDAAPFDWRRDFRVPGVDPRCIAACPRSGRLYLVDWLNMCIWTMTKDGTANRFEPPTGAEVDCPRSVSVSATSRLLVVGRQHLGLYADGGCGDEGAVRVTLPEWMDPQHAVETASGTFVVGYTPKSEGEATAGGGCGVSEVDSSGTVIREFVWDRPGPGGRLSWPYHVALDQDGRVFVADFGNRRVLMLNSELRVERIVCGESPDDGGERKESRAARVPKLDKPCGLCYVGRTGQLMVSEWLTGVKVFGVR